MNLETAQLTADVISMIPDRVTSFHVNADLEAERCAFGQELCVGEHKNSADAVDRELDLLRLELANAGVTTFGSLSHAEVFDFLAEMENPNRTFRSLECVLGRLQVIDVVILLMEANLVDCEIFSFTAMKKESTHTESRPILFGHDSRDHQIRLAAGPDSLNPALQLTQKGRDYHQRVKNNPGVMHAIQQFERYEAQAEDRTNLQNQAIQLHANRLKEVDDHQMNGLMRAVLALPVSTNSVTMEQLHGFMEDEDMLDTRDNARYLMSALLATLDRNWCKSDRGSNPREIHYLINSRTIIRMLSYVDYLESMGILTEALEDMKW